jgi:hypothetical protein
MPVSIRSDIIVEGNALPNYIAFVEAYPGLALETARDAFNREVKPPLLSELKHYPGAVVYPFQFATERSRKAFFATNGFGRGLGAKRTGKLAEAWKVDISLSDNAVVMSARNTAPYQRYVTGKRQVPGHATTGWPLASETIAFWSKAAIEVVTRALDKLINQHR